MNDLRQNFLAESLRKLAHLQKTIREDFDETRRRELFRTIHTIKGGAQTFGLRNPAKLAAELETVLSSRESLPDRNLLLEGLALLSASIQSNEPNEPAGFLEKLFRQIQTTTKSEIFLTRIPPDIFNNFAKSEQTAAISALRRGENILCAEVGFEPADFAGEYRSLRKILSEKSEIIAALPSAKFSGSGKIGFQLFLASRETAENLQKAAENFAVEISSHACFENRPDDLFEILGQIAAHGENIAKQLGKSICINILTNETKLSGQKKQNIFDILLQLMRNSVDHGIEKTGNIEIRLFDQIGGLHLTFADNGKGIDPAKVRARAVEKNLISDDDVLNDQQTLEFIFAPELSTRETATEISGRGVGLDAVRELVEKMNGKISVKSRKTIGTTFEIFLPD
jgi:chemotaxis protein histidine kinase CheA